MSYTAYKDLEGIIIIHDEDNNEFALIDQEIWIYPGTGHIQFLTKSSRFRLKKFNTFTLIECWRDLVPNINSSWMIAEKLTPGKEQKEFLLKYL